MSVSAVEYYKRKIPAEYPSMASLQANAKIKDKEVFRESYEDNEISK